MNVIEHYLAKHLIDHAPESPRYLCQFHVDPNAWSA